MTNLFIIFWGILIAASLFWYFFLVFYVGWKAGRDILDLTRSLGDQAERKRSSDGASRDRGDPG